MIDDDLSDREADLFTIVAELPPSLLRRWGALLIALLLIFIAVGIIQTNKSTTDRTIAGAPAASPQLGNAPPAGVPSASPSNAPAAPAAPVPVQPAPVQPVPAQPAQPSPAAPPAAAPAPVPPASDSSDSQELPPAQEPDCVPGFITVNGQQVGGSGSSIQKTYPFTASTDSASVTVNDLGPPDRCSLHYTMTLSGSGQGGNESYFVCGRGPTLTATWMVHTDDNISVVVSETPGGCS